MLYLYFFLKLLFAFLPSSLKEIVISKYVSNSHTFWLPDVQGEHINNVQNVVCSFSDISTLWNFSGRIWPAEPRTQIPWIDRATQSQACCSIAAKGKIEEYGIGALLLPSSSRQNHELTIDHISIMKLSAFWCISQDQCLDLSGLVKWIQELWKRCLFLSWVRQCI